MIKPIKAWAAIKNNKLDAMEIYADKDIILLPGESLIRVEIKPHEPEAKRVPKRKN